MNSPEINSAPWMSQSCLSDALLASSEGIVCMDQEHSIVYYNQGAANLLGYTLDTVIGRPFEDLLVDNSLPTFRNALEELRFGLEPSRIIGTDGTLVCRRREGDRLPVQATISWSAESGDCAYAVVLRPVAPLRRQEAALALLAELGASLSASLECEMTMRTFARIVVERFADFCLLVIEPADGCCARIELAHRRQGREDSIRARLDVDVARRLRPITDAIHTGHPSLNVASDFQRLPGDSGPADWLTRVAGADSSWMVVPLRARGRSLGASLFVREGPGAYEPEDVQLALELAHRAAIALENDRLYEAMTRTLQAHDEMLSFVSHDLRNPLNVITMAAQLIRERLPAGQDFAVDWLSAIDRSAQQMEALVRDLLTAARSSQGRLTLQPRIIATDLVLREAALGHREAAQRKQIDLQVRPADAGLSLVADLDVIVRALSNLIGNAVKFTPPGGTVFVAAEDSADEVRFSVSDTGPGIDEAHLAHVFERFWQAPGPTRDGAGLGLAIVKGAVEAHGGRVGVESRVGHGSTFSFTIPHDREPDPRDDMVRPRG